MLATHGTLVAVTHISSSSVFLLPADGHVLDFKTVSSAPSAHRSLLQKNGLIAKVCIAVTATGGSRAEQQELITTEGRLKLWRDALIKANLLACCSPTVPANLSNKQWPLISESDFSARMRFMNARHEWSDVNGCSYCAPILSVQEFHFKEGAHRVMVGVVWMPRFCFDLFSWTEMHMQTGKWVAEARLTSAIQHLTVALDTLRKVAVPTLSDPTQCMGCPLTFEMKHVLVNTSNAEPVFAITASQLRNTRTLEALQSLDLSTTRELNAFPYVAPEQVGTADSPMRAPTYDMWALGMIVYNVASGTPSAASQAKRFKRRLGEMPLNHPAVTPATVVERLRRDFKLGSYSSVLVSVVALLLSTDPQTRPTLATVGAMMQDLCRGTPILRFPLVLGSLELLRVEEPARVQLNVAARKYLTSDLCCLCRKERNLTKCGAYDHAQHAPAVTSPLWHANELLPGLHSSADSSMAYLYPLTPAVDEKVKRRLLSHAIQCPNTSLSGVLSAATSTTLGATAGDLAASIRPEELFQHFGGFAVMDVVEGSKNGKSTATVRDVLVPYPANGLRRSEVPMSALQMHFAAALPWPSHCTKQLQRRGRIVEQVPYAFVGKLREVKWFAWVLPGEVFRLENGHKWVPAQDGAFVFWFNSTLEPSDQDRYFPVASTRALTGQTRVSSTTLPDNLFRHHVGRDTMSTTLHNLSNADSSRSFHNSLAVPLEESVRMQYANRRRSSLVPLEVEMPWTTGIVERDTCTRLTAGVVSGEDGCQPSSYTASNNNYASSSAHRRSSSRRQRPQNLHNVNAFRASTIAENTDFTYAGTRTDNGAIKSAPAVAALTLSPTLFAAPNILRLIPSPLAVGAPTSPSIASTANADQNDRGWCRDGQSPEIVMSQCSTNGMTPAHTPSPGRVIELSNTTPAKPLTLLNPNHHNTELPPHKNADTSTSPTATVALARPTTHATKPVEQSQRQGLTDADYSVEPASMSRVRVFGHWLPTNAIEASFNALTFWIHGTGEHGFLQVPTTLRAHVRAALKAPEAAEHMAFLSNQIPLLTRNHGHSITEKFCGRAMLMPYHGFVFYDAEEQIVGLLALRCSLSAAYSGLEFPLSLAPMQTKVTSVDSASAYYPSLLSNSIEGGTGDSSKADYATAAATTLQHSQTLLAQPGRSGGEGEPPMSRSGHMLTFSSARKLLGAFTPKNDFVTADTSFSVLHNRSRLEERLPACWLGFDYEDTALTFSGVDQTTWYSFRLCDSDS